MAAGFAAQPDLEAPPLPVTSETASSSLRGSRSGEPLRSQGRRLGRLSNGLTSGRRTLIQMLVGLGMAVVATALGIGIWQKVGVHDKSELKSLAEEARLAGLARTTTTSTRTTRTTTTVTTTTTTTTTFTTSTSTSTTTTATSTTTTTTTATSTTTTTTTTSTSTSTTTTTTETSTTTTTTTTTATSTSTTTTTTTATTTSSTTTTVTSTSTTTTTTTVTTTSTTTTVTTTSTTTTVTTTSTTTTSTTVTTTPPLVGWPATDKMVGGEHWCRVEVPEADWTLSSQSCKSYIDEKVRLKVMSFDMYWWDLKSIRKGKSAFASGKLIADSHKEEPIDLLGFQESEDADFTLETAGLRDEFQVISGKGALAMAYRKENWAVMDQGQTGIGADVNLDGARDVQWVRLQHKETQKKVFFMNTYGPGPVNTGGLCGNEATAFNMLKAAALNSHTEDAIVLVGDFNADSQSPMLSTLGQHLHHAYSGSFADGVDNFFTSCGPESVREKKNLGPASSEHDALHVVFEV